MATKTTNKEFFNVISEIIATAGIPESVETSLTPDEILSWIETRIDLLSKKATTPSKAERAKQEQNAKIAEAVIQFVTENAGTSYTTTELTKSVPEIGDVSTQKLSPILKKLMTEGKIEKIATNKGSKWGIDISAVEAE